MIKLKPKVDRKPKGWKITSIRIPFETAQKVESLGIRAGVRSATETIIQLLEQATASVKALSVKKLEWAKKADASARKDYSVVARKGKKAKAKAAKKAVRKFKKLGTSAKRQAKAKAAVKSAKHQLSPEQKAAKAKADKTRREAKKVPQPPPPNSDAREQKHEEAVENA